MKIATKTIHIGQEPEETSGAIIPPIYQSTTFAQIEPGKPFASYEYTRAGNPSFSRLEKTLAAIENGKYATVFSAGLAAFTAWLSSIGNCRILANADLYGGTYRLISQVFKKLGYVADFVNEVEDVNAWKRLIRRDTNWILIESPTNPLLRVVDIETICKIAHAKNAKVIVDNTFASPRFQQPLDIGADVVVHSTTKYLSGHSDVVGGVLITNDIELKKRFDFSRKAMGLNPSPFDCWLISRGLKTLTLRMEQHSRNAAAVVKCLKHSDRVKDVRYPGFGGVVSVKFKNKMAAATFIKRLKIFRLAESLGGVESLVCQPSTMTHASMPRNIKTKIGITDELVRLSVGIEDVDDILNDIRSALKHT